MDASRSRLYVFENGPNGLQLIADHYASIGRLGPEKSFEGDQRTPLGVYFITSNLDRKSLKDFYGSGALPINYPNQLDIKRGKTGGGIWLHGTPSSQFARAPQASDGCVVLANPDLEHIIRTVEVRTTPVVIPSISKWISPRSTEITLAVTTSPCFGTLRLCVSTPPVTRASCPRRSARFNCQYLRTFAPASFSVKRCAGASRRIFRYRLHQHLPPHMCPALSPSFVTFATKASIAFLVGPSFHDGSGSPPVACAAAGIGRESPDRAGTSASDESMTRRVMPEGVFGCIFSSSAGP